MTAEEKRDWSNKMFERLREGEDRKKLYYYLISQQLDKLDASSILDTAQGRLNRKKEIEKGERDLSFPIFLILLGIVLLVICFVLYSEMGVSSILSNATELVIGGATSLLIGVISLMVKIIMRIFSKTKS
ncbi:MAG: hypothetical protein ACPG4Z_02645 [Chitinophagales bacterium]